MLHVCYNPPPDATPSPQVSTAEAAELELIIGDDVSCADPGEGSLTGDFVVEDTAGEDDDELWGEAVAFGVAMPAGTHSLKLCVRGGTGISVDSITFDLVSELSGPGGDGTVGADVWYSRSGGRSGIWAWLVG